MHVTKNAASTTISLSDALNNTTSPITVNVDSNASFGASTPIFCTIGQPTSMGFIDLSHPHEYAEITALPSGGLTLTRAAAVKHVGKPVVIATADARSIDEIQEAIVALQSSSGGGGSETWSMFIDPGFQYTTNPGGWAWNDNIFWPGQSTPFHNAGWIQGPQSAGDEITFKVFLNAGTHTFRFVYAKCRDGGQVDAAIGSTALGTIDCYDGTATFGVPNYVYEFSNVTISSSGAASIRLVTSSSNTGRPRIQAIYVVRTA
jgi:hypothetical protein